MKTLVAALSLLFISRASAQYNSLGQFTCAPTVYTTVTVTTAYLGPVITQTRTITPSTCPVKPSTRVTITVTSTMYSTVLPMTSPAASGTQQSTTTTTSTRVNTQTSTIPVTGPTLPTFTPAASSSSLSCPRDAGKLYGVSGRNFMVTCYQDFVGQDLGAPVYVTSLEACAAACAANISCTSAVWRPAAADGPCYLKSGTGGQQADNLLMGVMAA